MSELCRLCLSKTSETISLTEYREGLSLSVLAMIILPVKILENENLPKSICNDCLRTILSAYKLRDVSVDSEKYLKSIMKEPEIDIKTESLDYLTVFIESPEDQPNSQQNNHQQYQNPPKTCVHCTAEFSNTEELNQHWRMIHLNTQYSTVNEDHIDKFIIDCYKKDKTKKTSTVWRYFGNLYDQNGQHVDIDFHYCTLCLTRKTLSKYRRTSSTSTLITHLTVVHGFNTEQIQPRDNYIKYRQSKQQALTTDGATVCSECGKSFGSSQILRKHMQVHSELIHRCDKCPAQFNYFEGLHRHKRCHDPNQSSLFICDICGDCFAVLKSLEKHMIRVHLNIPPEKKFRCSYDGCSFAFVTAYYLQKHMLTHTEVKPHECQYCGNGYASKGDLTKHLQKKHVGDAVYNCEFCPQSFRLQVQLRDHYRVHYESVEMIKIEN